MTSALYYDDPSLLEFDATVIRLDQADDLLAVVLDRTAFYPEGGGQPADQGEIAGLAVRDVRKSDGVITHLIDPAGRPDATRTLHPGDTIRARVDAARRRDYAQQHTGQHILSGALMRVGGYETVSVHQGADYTTIEVPAPNLPAADLAEVERLANGMIEADLPVSAQWVDESRIHEFPLRRPPKVSGSIRLVQIADFDCVACGGVHVERTGQIRLVRALSVETIRGNVRIAWKIGDRALEHYRRCSDIVAALGSSLSAQPEEIPERVAKQDERIRDAELENRALRKRLHALVARSLLTDAEPVRGERVITAEFDDEPGDFLRGITEELVSQTGVAACLVNRGEGRVQWSVGIAPGSRLDFNALKDELLPLIAGKGGGRPPVWQGVGTEPAGAQQFLMRFTELAGRR